MINAIYAAPAIKEQQNMIEEMVTYAFGNPACPMTREEKDKTEDALAQGYVVIVRADGHYAIELIAAVLLTDIAQITFEACGPGHMLINPDGFVSYATPGLGTITTPFN
jgi:hypothetical protein